MIGSLVGFLIFGLIAGAIARALVPGKDAFTWPQTALLGCAGSFVGGFLGRLVGNDSGDGFIQRSSWIGSILGGVIVLIAYKKYGKGAGQGKR
jgi:uncharacterized membrane protein YeaQ/YmgE (transglycosylase-associated protein family)